MLHHRAVDQLRKGDIVLRRIVDGRRWLSRHDGGLCAFIAVGTLQPGPYLRAGIRADGEELTVEHAGAVLSGAGDVVLTQLEEHGHLVFDAIPEHWSHADLLGALLAVAVILDDVLRLGPKRDGDVHGALEHAVHQLVVLGRNLAPGGIAVATALGDVALHVQQTAFAGPGVGKGVDDQELHAVLFRYVDSLKVSRRAEGRFQVDGQVFAHAHAIDHGADVQGAGLVLRVDHAQLLPYIRVGYAGMRRPDQSVAQQQGAQRLAAAGGSRDAQL